MPKPQHSFIVAQEWGRERSNREARRWSIQARPSAATEPPPRKNGLGKVTRGQTPRAGEQVRSSAGRPAFSHPKGGEALVWGSSWVFRPRPTLCIKAAAGPAYPGSFSAAATSRLQLAVPRDVTRPRPGLPGQRPLPGHPCKTSWGTEEPSRGGVPKADGSPEPFQTPERERCA